MSSLFQGIEKSQFAFSRPTDTYFCSISGFPLKLYEEEWFDVFKK